MKQLTAVKFNVPKVEQTITKEDGTQVTVVDYPAQLTCENGATNCPDYTPIERAIVGEVFRDDAHTLHYAHALPVDRERGEVVIPIISEVVAPYFAAYLTDNPEMGVYQDPEEL